jgi:hypothetical protein
MRKSSRALLALVVLAACEGPPSAPSGSLAQPIVNGSPEPGWPGVGALTVDVPGFGYAGALCSGTLIAPRWVLLAAHCLEAEEAGGPLPPEWLAFYLGPDANPDADGQRPADGTFVPVERWVRHPQWSRELNTVHDVALLRLAAPVRGVDPYPLNTRRLEGREGTPLFYVGYGADEGWQQTGAGVKRSTTLTLQQVRPGVYLSTAADTGVCFGDSGGPGFLQVDGQWAVAGVNSALGVEGDADPCLGSSIQTRVDAELAWIRQQMGESVSCASDPSLCQCPQACLPSGYCDDDLCRPKTDCTEATACYASCADPICQLDCYLDASSKAGPTLVALLHCMSTWCPESVDPLADDCVRMACSEELSACVGPVPPAPAPCEDAWRCTLGCGGLIDPACADTCAAQVPDERDFAGLVACLDAGCADRRDDPVAWGECAARRCADRWRACLPPTRCRVGGGTCDGGACLPTPGGGVRCVDTAGLGPGAACTPRPPALGADCADGLACAAGRCAPACVDDADCPGGEVCLRDAPALSGVGTCGCVDADGDGACAADDCDDHDARTWPGAPEACGGGDEDCDGLVDEGCAPPPPPASVPPSPPGDCNGDPPPPECGADHEQALPATLSGCSAAPGRDPGAVWLLAPLLRRPRRRPRRA